MTEIVVSKIDAAIRQLNCAIELFFEDADPVPIHTLACAGHRIVHDINRAKGGPELLFDAVKRSEGRRRELTVALHTHANYFKHADRDSCPDCGIRFSPEITEVIIYSALLGLCHMKLKLSAVMAAYIVYMRTNSALLPSDIWRGFKVKAAVPDTLLNVKNVDREEFLHQFLSAVAEDGENTRNA